MEMWWRGEGDVRGVAALGGGVTNGEGVAVGRGRGEERQPK